MLNQECKICGAKFHWCASCDPGLDGDIRQEGYCSKLCKALSFGEDPDEEDLFLAYQVIEELMNENIELQARLSQYEDIENEEPMYYRLEKEDLDPQIIKLLRRCE